MKLTAAQAAQKRGRTEQSTTQQLTAAQAAQKSNNVNCFSE